MYILMGVGTVRKIHINQRGITGLETAIILIAFVVVAAVFAYTVLSAGLFSSQESSEAVYSALEETQSTVIQNGSLIAAKGVADVDTLYLTVQLAQDGTAIDFTPTAGGSNSVVLSYMDKNQRHDDLTWTMTRLGDCDSDNLLEQDEKFQIILTGLEAALDPNLTTDTTFSIELKPPSGATLIIQRTTPKVIDNVLNLK